MAVKSCSEDICRNPATEQVEKLFWERERDWASGYRSNLPVSPRERLVFSAAMKSDRAGRVKTTSL